MLLLESLQPLQAAAFPSRGQVELLHCEAELLHRGAELLHRGAELLHSEAELSIVGQSYCIVKQNYSAVAQNGHRSELTTARGHAGGNRLASGFSAGCTHHTLPLTAKVASRLLHIHACLSLACSFM